MAYPNTDSPEEAYTQAFKCERLVLPISKTLGERLYKAPCAAFDPREFVGLDSILKERNRGKLIKIHKESVSITDSGLKRLEEEEK